MRELLQYADEAHFPIDVCDEFEVPAARRDPLESAPVMSLKARLSSAAAVGGGGGVSGGSAVTPPAPQACLRRVMREMRSLLRRQQQEPETWPFEIFPSQSNMLCWQLLLRGPEGTPYAGGVWLLWMRFGAEFPRTPPEVRFITRIKHCNINSYGRVCHSVLDRNWSADVSVATVLQCINGLLLSPDTEDPLDSQLALQFFEGSGVYEISVVRHTERFAQGRSVEEWRAVLGVEPVGEGESEGEIQDEGEEEHGESGCGEEEDAIAAAAEAAATAAAGAVVTFSAAA